jgi:Lrp/AsnC family transcriptional regulator, leucine-responsive regulatory protein
MKTERRSRRARRGAGSPIPSATERQQRRDREILGILERDGRISFSSLGEQVGLSKSPTWNRVHALEARGVIKGFRAVIDPSALGLDIHAFVQLKIRSSLNREFELAVLRHPSILECYSIAGQADYLLHVLVSSVTALDQLLRNELARMPGVENLTTTVGMKTIKPLGFVTECAARDRAGRESGAADVSA